MVDTGKGFINKRKETIGTQIMTYQGTHVRN